MKKFFALAAFMCALILTTTVFAANAVLLGTDTEENEWYIDSESVSVVKNDGGELIFKGAFLMAYSDAGRDKVIKRFKDAGNTMPDNLASQVLLIQFREFNGEKYYALTDMYYNDVDGNVIEGKGFSDEPVEWDKINADTIVDGLFNASHQYIEN